MATNAIIEPNVVTNIKPVITLTALQNTEKLEKLDTKLNVSLIIDMRKELESKLRPKPNTSIGLKKDIGSLMVITNAYFPSKVRSRVVYDRVRKRKNYFEIPAFLQIERGKSRACGKIQNIK